MKDKPPMKVCYFGTYRAEYNRNKIMIAALKSAGVEVIICHETLWHSIEDRENITAGGWRNPKFWLRVIRAYTKLLWKYINVTEYDVMVVGYPDQFDTFLACVLVNCKKKPLVLDVLISLYLVSKERGLEHKRYSATKFLKTFEKKALKKPDLLLLDTQVFTSWFEENLQISVDRFKVVPIGADDSVFYPQLDIDKDGSFFTILYYGTYIPNHGIKTIMEAAIELKNEEGIRLIMIGDGPERKMAESYAAEYDLRKVLFKDWIPQQELVKEIIRADVCLGAFGDRPQSLLTVHNKVYECMALGKTDLVAKTPAILAQFTDEKELKICEPSGKSIADGVLYLKNNPELLMRIGKSARQSFVNKYSTRALGNTYRAHLENLLKCK